MLSLPGGPKKQGTASASSDSEAYRQIALSVAGEYQADSRSARKLRENWSKDWKYILGAQLLFMNGLFAAIGLGWLEYDQPWLVQIFFSGTMLEVFGIAYVMVKNLFPEDGSNSARRPDIKVLPAPSKSALPPPSARSGEHPESAGEDGP